MEEGGTKPASHSDGSEWPTISDEERILYETLFYSQGPVDGYILGEGVQDLFLKSGLSLRVLSQVWNLADVSHDNVLNVHEFVLAIHLIRGLIRGLKLPATLPRKLTPPKTAPICLSVPTEREREAYTTLFNALDGSKSGALDGEKASHVFLAAGLPRETLAHIWNLSDVNRDGKLDLEEFCVACHLLRFVKQGNSLSGPVDVFQLLPERIASQSLQARKQRVQKYEQHKQKLMSLKEKRRQQVTQENRRLQLQEEKIGLLKKLYTFQKKTGKAAISEETFKANLLKEKEEVEKLEEIVYRLKKEHEKVRQETVKIILAEQKLSQDIQTIKKDTDELNKRLSTTHTHATKDPDPFHQLYEQRKEKRQGSTIKDLDKIDVTYPFKFSPFDPGVTAEAVTLGTRLFQESGGNNHPPKEQQLQAVLQKLGDLGEEFVTAWGRSVAPTGGSELEEDPVFKEVPVSMESERWMGLQWEGPGSACVGMDKETEELHEKLLALKDELQKLNEPGSRLLFKNPDDYLARKRAREEEEKSDRARFHRRSATERRSQLQDRGDSPLLRTRSDNSSPRLRDRHSYHFTSERNEDVSQVVREYRQQKRLSQHSAESSAHSSVNSSPNTTPTDTPRETPSPNIPERPSRSKKSESPRSPVQAEPGPSPTPSTEDSRRSKEEKAAAPASPGPAVRPKDLSGISSRSYPVLPEPVIAATVPATAAPAPKNQSDQQRVNGEPEDKQATPVAEKKPEGQRAKSPEGSHSVSPARPSSKKTRAPPPPPEVTSPRSQTVPSALPRAKQPKLVTQENTAQAEQNSGPVVSSQKAPDVSSQKGPDVSSARQQVPSSTASDTTVPRLNLDFDQPQPDSPRDTKDKPQPPSPERPVRPKRRKDSGSNSNPSSPRDAPSQPALQADTKDANGGGPALVENLSVVEEEVPLVSQGPTKTVSAKPSQPSAGSTESEPVKQKRLSKKGKAPAPPPPSESLSEIPSPRNTPRDAADSTWTKAAPPTLPTSPAVDPPAQKFTKGDSREEPSVTTKVVKTEVVVKATKPDEHLNSDKPNQRKDSNENLSSKESTEPEPPTQKPELTAEAVTEPTPPVNKVSATTSDFDRVCVSLDKEVEKTDSDRGRTSETSSAYDSDADSIPPPLPSSAPPPLPNSPPPSSSPFFLPQSVEEEVVEVRQVTRAQAAPPTSSSNYSKNEDKMEEGVLIEFDSMLPDSLQSDSTQQQQTKPMTDLRAEFFGITSSNGDKPKVTSGDLDLFDSFEPMQPSNNQLSVHHDDVMSGDSDLSSDERGFEGTFSPGDSGVMMSSIPTSPDESDGKIQLVSYKQDVISQPPSDNSRANFSITDTISFEETQPSFASRPGKETSRSSRPQTLEMKNSSSPNNLSSPSPTRESSAATSASLTPQDMAALSPRNREIFEKARHFADMVNKPTFVAKRENVAEEEFSPEMLQDFELERRAAISQSTVRRRKDVSEIRSPTRDEDYSFKDTVEPAAPAEATTTTSPSSTTDLHPSTPERPASPVPEARWNGSERTGRVKLYSENVVQEADSTDSVDRESIANLATTRRQWETKFNTDQPEESPRKPKKNAPKWEVRLPYAEKKVPDANTVTSVARDSESEEEEEQPTQTNKGSSGNMAGPENESAIAREIRLTMEREEMLRKEQEERMKLAALQQQQRDTFKPSSMQSSTESELQQPSYHELTEADRGAEFLIQDRVAQQEDAEQEESLQRGNMLHNHQKHGGQKGAENREESIIEREIRLQREREAELAKQRGVRSSQPSYAPPPEAEVQASGLQSPPHEEEVEESGHREIEYEEAISQYHHEGESRIAQELRELREREEEVRRLREAMSRAQVSASPQQQQQQKAPSQSQSGQSTPPVRQQPTQSKPVPTPRSEKPSTPRTPQTPTTPRGNIHGALLDTSTPPKTSTPPVKQETPIEREIRLARERENELRRAKGMPELKPEPEKEVAEVPEPDIHYSDMPRRHHPVPPPDSTMRRLASSRLQQEIVDQRNREMALRQEGKIITTSEEHIQPLKYNEVIGDHVDGPVKRSFKTPARRGSGASQDSVEAVSNTPTTPRAEQPATHKKGQGSVPSFSYREFKQTAESKIERELREMREREEELRRQRGGGSSESEVAAQ